MSMEAQIQKRRDDRHRRAVAVTLWRLQHHATRREAAQCFEIAMGTVIKYEQDEAAQTEAAELYRALVGAEDCLRALRGEHEQPERAKWSTDDLWASQRKPRDQKARDRNTVNQPRSN